MRDGGDQAIAVPENVTPVRLPGAAPLVVFKEEPVNGEIIAFFITQYAGRYQLVAMDESGLWLQRINFE
ncbi:hypothetical protein KCP74_12420 [Salmonella enterica subsp. enterica]|nr:hypothetical protein KCP74_12420 [Salmonella enterica subsp. enterica]